MAELLEHTQLNHEQTDLLADLRQSGERLLVLIQQVLQFNSIESGALKLNAAPFDVRDFCHALMTTYHDAADAKTRKLSFLSPQKSPIRFWQMPN